MRGRIAYISERGTYVTIFISWMNEAIFARSVPTWMKLPAVSFSTPTSVICCEQFQEPFLGHFWSLIHNCSKARVERANYLPLLSKHFYHIFLQRVLLHDKNSASTFAVKNDPWVEHTKAEWGCGWLCAVCTQIRATNGDFPFFHFLASSHTLLAAHGGVLWPFFLGSYASVSTIIIGSIFYQSNFLLSVHAHFLFARIAIWFKWQRL